MVSRDVRRSTHVRSATQLIVSDQMPDAAFELWIFGVSLGRYVWVVSLHDGFIGRRLRKSICRSWMLVVTISQLVFQRVSGS